MNVLMDYDYGPDFRYNDQSGVMTNVVPPIKQIIPTPALQGGRGRQRDRGREIRAPAGASGNLHELEPGRSGPLKGNEGSLSAGYIPFAMTKAERIANRDPRRSIEERYGSQEGYDCVVRHAAKKEVRKRLLLQEDADRLIAQAAASNVLPSDPDNRIARRLCKDSDGKHDDHHHGDRDHDNHDRRHH